VVGCHRERVEGELAGGGNNGRLRRRVSREEHGHHLLLVASVQGGARRLRHEGTRPGGKGADRGSGTNAARGARLRHPCGGSWNKVWPLPHAPGLWGPETSASGPWGHPAASYVGVVGACSGVAGAPWVSRAPVNRPLTAICSKILNCAAKTLNRKVEVPTIL
jgi:hypothetical protein